MDKNFFSGAVFLAFITLSSLMSASFIRPALSATGTPPVPDIIQGKWSPEFEKTLGKTLPVYDISRSFWGWLEYTLFHQGRKGVLIGADGWLFTDEEFSCPPGAAQNLKDNMTYVAATRNFLAQKNTELVVALVPAKARLFPGHLGANRVPSCRLPVYDQVLKFMAAHSIHAADLLTAMRGDPDHETFYLRTDTHWTPAGAQFAARRIQALVAEKLTDVRLTPAHFSVIAGAVKTRDGDLMRYVPGAPARELLPDRFPAFATEQATQVADAGNSLFDDTHVPAVTLVGTSYSANASWNFDGFLKTALQADLLNAAEEGQGPLTVMDKYLKNEAWKSSPPRLLIWEIPERYLLMPHGVPG